MSLEQNRSASPRWIEIVKETKQKQRTKRTEKMRVAYVTVLRPFSTGRCKLFFRETLKVPSFDRQTISWFIVGKKKKEREEIIITITIITMTVITRNVSNKHSPVQSVVRLTTAEVIDYRASVWTGWRHLADDLVVVSPQLPSTVVHWKTPFPFHPPLLAETRQKGRLVLKSGNNHEYINKTLTNIKLDQKYNK